MLTSLMPAMANALRGVLTDQQTRGLMQALGNCNQPLVHNGPVSTTPQMPRSTGGGTWNDNYWNQTDYGDILNTVNGDNINNTFSGDSFTYVNQLFPTFNNVNNSPHNLSTGNLNNSFPYNHGGDSFYDFADRSTIRLGDVFSFTNPGDTITNLINNPPGQRGERGSPGADGRDSYDGRDGSPGARGEVGPEGELGPPGLSFIGPAGPQGQEGPDGKDGLNGPAGPAGITAIVFVGGPALATAQKLVVTDVQLVKDFIDNTFVSNVKVECNEDGEIEVELEYGSLPWVKGLRQVKDNIRVLRQI